MQIFNFFEAMTKAILLDDFSLSSSVFLRSQHAVAHHTLPERSRW